MSWPHPPDYNEAIQNPRFCFNDPELQRGQPAVNALGLPWPRSGNHADVYKLECPGGQTWAVKCFTREVHDLRRRYQAISDHLRQTALPAMVEFHYQDEGIRVHGQWYPIVKMRWVDGQTLNELLREHADKPQVLERLAQLWLRLAQEMRNARITHGDLQHGNVLLVPGATPGTLKLRLVDYDGLVVPALVDVPSGEVGHPNYQHPQRLREGTYDAEVDRFAHLLIYTTIRGVAVAGRSLWERYDNGENFLFREQDFQEPARSALFRELSELSDPEARALTGHLLLASLSPLERVPLLDEIIVNGTVRPLDKEQQRQVTRCLSGEPAPEAPAPEPSNEPTAIRLDQAGTATLVLGTRKKTWRGPYAPPRGRFALGEVLYRRGRRTARRLSGWSLTALLLFCAGLGLATFAVMVGVVFLIGTLLFAPAKEAAAEGNGQRPLPTVAAPPSRPSPPIFRPNQPPTEAARLLPLPDVVLRPGLTRTLRVRVRREGHNGRLELEEPHDLPEGVAARVLLVSDGDPDALQLELRAAPTAPEGGKRIDLRAILGGQTIPGASFYLTVRHRRSPHPLRPDDLVLKAGQKRFLRVEVAREDHQGPIGLELHGLPEWVTCKPATVAADQITAFLELQAAANAPGGEHAVEVWTLVAGEKAGAESFRLRVQAAPPAPEPEMPSENVRFSTVDGVTLAGTWYPGTGGIDSACVLLLHEPGRGRSRADWQRLARKLQRKGHAALVFDFRGHGDSTQVGPSFWKAAGNSGSRIQNPFDPKPPKTIRFEEFAPAYTATLVNDIAAAAAFLERKNDLQECNASKLLLVGAGEGAVLGSMWLYAEWHRFQVTSPEPLLLSQAPEGRHCLGAVWASMRPQLGGRPCRADEWLKFIGSDRRVPIGFLYGEGDEPAAEFARRCLREMKPAGPIRRLTAARAVRGTTAAGHALLEQEPTDTFVESYLTNVLQTVPPPPWSRRTAAVRTFYWRFGGPDAVPIPAKSKGEILPRLVPLEKLP